MSVTRAWPDTLTLPTVLGGLGVVAVSLCGVATSMGQPEVVLLLGAALWLAVLTRLSASVPQLPILLIILTSSAVVLLFIPAQIGADQYQRERIELYGTFVGASIACAVLLLFCRPGFKLEIIHPRTLLLDLAVLSFIGIAVYSGVIGLLRGSGTSLLAGDLYRLFTLPTIYLIVVNSLRRPAEVRPLIYAIGVLILVQHARDAVTAIEVLGSGEASRLKSVFWIQNLVGVIALIVIANSKERSPRKLAALYAAVCLLLVGLSRGFRTYGAVLIGLIALLVVLRIVRPARLLTSALRLSAVLLPLLIVVLTIGPSRTLLVSSLSSVWSRVEALQAGDDQSSAQRSLEVSLVVDDVLQDPRIALLGAGAGAVYVLPDYASATALDIYANENAEIHNVHNSFAGISYRYGLVGLAAYLFLYLSAWMVSLRAGRKAEGSWGYFAWFPLFVVASFVFASPFWTLVPGDIYFPIAIGLAAVLLRRDDVPDQVPEAEDVRPHAITAVEPA